MTCCGVSIRNSPLSELRKMPPVLRWSCGATRVCVTLLVLTFQSDHGRERRFTSFTSPSIYKDSKNAPIQPSRKFSRRFSADLRASALAMLMSKTDLFPDHERVHQEKPGAQALGSSFQIAESPHRSRRVLR